jgi:ubiquitin-conjugating enzyme E2 Z
MEGITLSKDTLRRVISDIKEIKKNPLDENGIFYKHDETNILRGYALIIPTTESPYQYGNYLFIIDFPTNYPFVPPKVTFMTNNGTTRFHPNLYRNGKVCLSLLNTWKGDQWTSCNTLTSVLVNILTLFNEDPFLNEPGIKSNHPEMELYNEIIEYQNFNTAIYDILFNKEFRSKLHSIEPFFRDIMMNNFYSNYETIMKKIAKNKSKNHTIYMSFYRMEETIDYALLINNYELKLKVS